MTNIAIITKAFRLARKAVGDAPPIALLHSAPLLKLQPLLDNLPPQEHNSLSE
jgi:hypothetical protein